MTGLYNAHRKNHIFNLTRDNKAMTIINLTVKLQNIFVQTGMHIYPITIKQEMPAVSRHFLFYSKNLFFCSSFLWHLWLTYLHRKFIITKQEVASSIWPVFHSW